MQDIGDFDPLDDILLSDEDVPQSKLFAKNTSSAYHKPDELDEDMRKNRKKKILAELFGTEDDIGSAKVASVPVIPSAPTSKKSDWLDLKNGDDIDLDSQMKDASFNLHKLSSSLTDKTTDASVIENAEKSVNFSNNFDSRRRSESGVSSAEKNKLKQNHQSLDFDFDVNIDPEPKDDNFGRRMINNGDRINIDDENTKTIRSSSVKEQNDTNTSYIPSSSTSRRFGHSRSRLSRTGTEDLLSLIAAENTPKSNPQVVKGTLPSWLESHSDKKDQFSTSNNTLEASLVDRPSDDCLRNEETAYITKKNGENTIDDKMHIASSVMELVKKQENLRQMANSQIESLSIREREIQNSAVELIQQQRDSIKALLKIISSDDVFVQKQEKCTTISQNDNITDTIHHLENTISQLQTKLLQNELEITESEMRSRHVERRHEMDLTMMEEVYKYKLQLAEEREAHLQKEIQLLEDEYNGKILKKKENEDELIRGYEKKIRTLQEEHLNEMKHAIEVHNLKYSFGNLIGDKSERRNNEQAMSKELTAREINLEEKQKQLLEFEERLTRERVALDGQKASLEVRFDQFEVKMAKEKFELDQLKKDLKLARNLFEEKESQWEREKQREREYVNSCKQELEVLKENLLKEERKLMKEKFELTAQNARLEAIMDAAGNPGGQIGDIVQGRAELQGTIEEVRRLKVKLEMERNEIKNETTRLKEENWRLKDFEQELMLQYKHFQKLLQEAEMKREEGIAALKEAQIIENQMDERVKDVEKRLNDLNQKEEALMKEKIEISKERDLLNKKKYQLDMILPSLSYEEQLPFNLLNRTIIDPRIMLMKLKTENDVDTILRQS